MKKTSNTKTRLPAAFHRIWTASAVSSLGDGVSTAALPLLAYSLTKSTVMLGVVTAAGVLPWLLFGLIGGALVDRWDRRTTMWITDLGRAGVLATALAGAAAGFLGIPLLIGLAFLLGTGQVLFDTAAMAYLPELLEQDQDQLMTANSRLQGAQRVTGSFIGPPVGSAIFAVGRMIPVALDAVSFVFSSLMTRTLPKQPRRAPAADLPRASLWADAKAGASFLVRNKLLLGLSLRPAIGNLGFGIISAVEVVFARQILHLGASGYGFFLAADAVGGLAGAALGPWAGRTLGTGTALTATTLVEALGLVGTGLSSNAFAACAFFAVTGAGMGATMVLGPSIRQAIVPNEMAGRVGAAGRLVSLCTFPTGAVLGGWIAEPAGLRAPFVIAACILAATSLLVGTMTNNRKIEAALAEAARLRAEKSAVADAEAVGEVVRQSPAHADADGTAAVATV